MSEINFNIIEVESDFNGSLLSLQTGELARLSDASVVCKYGDTVVLCNVVYDKKTGVKNDFFPLMVLYQEKYYASNRIPGGFLKREAKLSERETLISRLIDRSIRPLFDERFVNEVQVICTVLAYDGKHSPEFAAITAVSAALKISGVPILQTIAGISVGFDGKDFSFNTKNQGLLDLFVSGTKDSIMMVESQAQELSEEQIIDGINLAHEQIKMLCDFIDDFTAKSGTKTLFVIDQGEDLSSFKQQIEQSFGSDISNAFKIEDKTLRGAEIERIKNEISTNIIKDDFSEEKKAKILAIFKDVQKNIMRSRILNDGIRIDGRNTEQIRPISIRTGVLPGLHGSALFTRGETQALVVTTIGGEKEAQLIENLDGVSKQSFMLHYNFPAYSVNELGRYSGPGRREIGHGNLAHRALEVVIPNKRNSPYTIRVVSEILESNGSSSMATVCGGSLAMYNANIPLRRPVSGIAMGLIKDGDKIAILSDILGDEDHLGDMDFKVAGTSKGITALQMDIKILGVNIDILKQAINQAKSGRAYILEKMLPFVEQKNNQSDNQSNDEDQDENNFNNQNIVSETINIDPQRVREVIGQYGSVVNNISQQSNCQIDIDNSGLIKITSDDVQNIQNAKQMITNSLIQLEVGKIYDVVVTRVVDSYAIVSTDHGKTGMLHISEVSHSNIDNISYAISESEKLKAKVIEVSEGSRIKFSIKNINQINGKEFVLQDGKIIEK
jgi:polyribonucleotide nucleotidyltransferase